MTQEDDEETEFSYRTKRCELRDASGRQCVWGEEHTQNGIPCDFAPTLIEAVIGEEKVQES